MGCQCSNIPANLKIIRVGDSEVGLFDLRKTLSAVYRLEIEDETDLKKELLQRILQRIKEKNSVSPEREDIYAEALLREHRSFAKTQRPLPKQSVQAKKKSDKSRDFFKNIFSKRKSP